MRFRIFILAGSVNQYINFLRENNLDKDRFINIVSTDSLQRMLGIKEFAVIRIGTWYERPRELVTEVEHLEQLMLARNKGDK